MRRRAKLRRAVGGQGTATVLGVAWGTFAIVALLSFSAGLEDQMRTRAQGMGSGIVVLWPGTTARTWRGLPEGRPVRLEDADVDALLAEVPAIGAASPETIRREVVARRERVFRAAIVGVRPAYGALRSMRPAAGGRFLSERDEREARAVCFLGDRIARELFPRTDPVGRSIVLAGSPFTVVGVLEPKLQDSDYGGTDDERVCIPASTYRRRFGERFLDDLVFDAERTDLVPEAMRGATAVLARRHAFDPEDPSALQWWDTTEGDRIRGYAFLAMNVMTGGAGILTLLVGGLGIANLMFLVVRRRTAEIGLHLALGRRPSRVLAAVLGRALLLTGVGGAIGVTVALGFGRLVAATPLAESVGVPRISPILAFGVAALLVIVGVVAGWFPARRAARLDPVRALAEG
ncbi:MAG: ABC transporter permease [Planctomycetota bacterium]